MTYHDALNLIRLAKKGRNGFYDDAKFLVLDGKTKIIYEAAESPHHAGIRELRKLDDTFFHSTTIEEFADMLWLELGWSVNLNDLRKNAELMELFT